MAQGTVKWFNAEKGFGFITPDGGGPDVFVHYSEIQAGGYRSLEENQKVSYTVTQPGHDASYQGIYEETDHVLGHELVHVFQYSAATGPGGRGIQSTAALPLWLIEGMAEYMSLGRADPQTAMWMRSAVLRDEVPKYKELTDPRIFPYRYGQALCAYIGGRWGDERWFSSTRRRCASLSMRRYRKRSAFRQTSSSLSGPLRCSCCTGQRWPGEPIRPTVGVPVLADRQKEPGLDVAPVVSPDEVRGVLLQSVTLLHQQLIAEVATGRIIKRLTSPTGRLGLRRDQLRL